MKNIFPIIAFSLLTTTANAQKITAMSSVVDMGQVQFYTPTSGVFELKNTGRKPLIINKVDTGCGCTLVSYPTEPVAEGEVFSIRVTYDARQMGHFNRSIEVHSNGSKQPLLLYLRGVVVEEVTDFIGDFPFRLGELTADCNYIEFKDVRLGEVIQEKFHLYNPTGKVIQPRIQHLPNYLRADISPSSVGPNRSAEVTLTLDSRFMRDYGLTQTHLYLAANPGEKVSSEKEIGVSIVLLPAVADMTLSERNSAAKMQISATKVNLPIADGKKKSATIEITNIGKSRLEIQKLQMFTVGLGIDLNKKWLDAGETAKLKISINPKLMKNLKTSPRVLIITNDPGQPKVIVDVEVK